MAFKDRFRQILHPSVSGVLIFILLGCAGSRLKRLSEGDLPDELKDRFEISEEVAPKETVKAPQKKKKVVKKFKIPNRRPKVDPFYIGEFHKMGVSFLGLGAGIFRIEVLPYRAISGRKVYHFRAHAETSSIFALIYRVDDMIESHVDYEGLFSHRFHVVMDETPQTRDSLELYDSEKEETFFWSRWNHRNKGFREVKETKPIPAFPQDSLSSIFYIRTLPLEVGKKYEFPVVSEGKHWRGAVKVLRKEALETKIGKHQSLVLQLMPKYTGAFREDGSIFLYVSDDERRKLLKLDAKVKVGHIVAEIEEFRSGTPPEEWEKAQNTASIEKTSESK